MKRETFDMAAYQEWLHDAWRTESELHQCAMLDAYFCTRENLPGKSKTGEKLVPEPKTSTEIIYELKEMYDVQTAVLAKWMELHGFGLTTDGDGSVKWAIWRDMRPLM